MTTLHALWRAVLTLLAVLSPGAGWLVAPAGAQDFVPSVVFDMGGKFDKSFNEAAYQGAERFKKETGIAYREFEVTAEAQREQALRAFRHRSFQERFVTGSQVAAINPNPAVATLKSDAIALAIGVDHSAPDCVSGGALNMLNHAVCISELDVIFADGGVTPWNRLS